MLAAGKIRQRVSEQAQRLGSEIVEPRSLIEADNFESIPGPTSYEFRIGSGQSAAEAPHTAEQAELPLASPKTRHVRRSVDVSGKGVLVARLSRFKGTGLDILVFYADSTDALPLAITISQALETAGWNVRIWNGPPGQSVGGLLVQTREGADQTIQEPGVQLMLALQEIGLATRAIDSFGSDLPSDDWGAIGWENRKFASIRLMIGAKP
jgi:hypothetical protein